MDKTESSSYKLSEMTKEQLTLYAQNMGYSVDSSLSKEKLLKSIEEHRAKAIEQSHKITAESTKAHTSGEPEKTMHILFRYMEFEGADVTFVYDCGKGAANRREYHLMDGEEYDLPVDVIKHLHSKKVPDPKYVIDPVTGQGRTVYQTRQRFACLTV